MDHLTAAQKKQFLSDEFSIISKSSQNIDRNQAALLLEKFGFNSNNTQVSDLLDDANMMSDGFINLDDMLCIVDKLLENKNEPIELVDDEPDEDQLYKNLKKFVKRMKELAAKNGAITVTEATLKQLQQEFNIPDHLLE